MPGVTGNKGGGNAKNPCGAKTFVKGAYHECRRDWMHVLHHSKYQRQHCATKNVPALYWDATDEDIKVVEEQLGRVP